MADPEFFRLRKDWGEHVDEKYTNKKIKPKTEEAAQILGATLADNPTGLIKEGLIGVGRLHGIKYFRVVSNRPAGQLRADVPASRFFNLFNVDTGIVGGRFGAHSAKRNLHRRRRHRTRRCRRN